MPQVKFTRNLRRFFPDIDTVAVQGETVAEVVAELGQHYPGLTGYILDDHGLLRQHVNIFINEELIYDRKTLADPVQEEDQVYIMQALSGG